VKSRGTAWVFCLCAFLVFVFPIPAQSQWVAFFTGINQHGRWVVCSYTTQDAPDSQTAGNWARANCANQRNPANVPVRELRVETFDRIGVLVLFNNGYAKGSDAQADRAENEAKEDAIKKGLPLGAPIWIYKLAPNNFLYQGQQKFTYTETTLTQSDRMAGVFASAEAKPDYNNSITLAGSSPLLFGSSGGEAGRWSAPFKFDLNITVPQKVALVMQVWTGAGRGNSAVLLKGARERASQRYDLVPADIVAVNERVFVVRDLSKNRDLVAALAGQTALFGAFTHEEGKAASRGEYLSVMRAWLVYGHAATLSDAAWHRYLYDWMRETERKEKLGKVVGPTAIR